MVTTSAPPVEVHWTLQHERAALAADVRAGLIESPKRLPPRWLYDPRGSELFEQITTLPEYYPTRTERAILSVHAADIAAASGAVSLIELGAGTSDKTRLLLDALLAAGTLERFVAFDVAGPTIRSALGRLAEDYPTIELSGVVGDFEQHLEYLPNAKGRLVAFLGGTIGNLDPNSRARFLSSVAAQLDPGEGLLVGCDLVKASERLVAAYDDSAGVTAAFEKNVLSVINTALDADFDPDRFDYFAQWDPDARHIRMGLVARASHEVHITGLDLDVSFIVGEELETEISAKFEVDEMDGALAAAGFTIAGQWTDERGDFALTLGVKRDREVCP